MAFNRILPLNILEMVAVFTRTINALKFKSTFIVIGRNYALAQTAVAGHLWDGLCIPIRRRTFWHAYRRFVGSPPERASKPSVDPVLGGCHHEPPAADPERLLLRTCHT